MANVGKIYRTSPMDGNYVQPSFSEIADLRTNPNILLAKAAGALKKCSFTGWAGDRMKDVVPSCSAGKVIWESLQSERPPSCEEEP